MKLKFIKNICASVLAFSFLVAPISSTFSINRTEAQWAVIDAANLGVNIESAAVLAEIAVVSTDTAVNTTAIAASTAVIAEAAIADETKEFGWDALGWALVNMMIETMISDVTQWVASGFEGSPAFVTDLDGFLLDVADQAAGEFIYAKGGPLSLLCDPFSIQIQGALGLQYGNTGEYYQPRCSLSGVIENVENFVDGDFYAGGWDGFASMAFNANNNVYGQMFEAQTQLGLKIQNDRTRESQYLSFGDGFYSMQDCTDEEDGSETCVTTTPGNVIAGTINNALDLPNKRLSIADELDELIGAFLMQFVKGILSETGLSGFSSSGNSGQRTTRPPDPVAREMPETGSEPDAPDSDIENAYRNIKIQILTLIKEKEALCKFKNPPRTLPASVTNQYNALKNETSKIHTSEDVSALNTQYESLKIQLDKLCGV